MATEMTFEELVLEGSPTRLRVRVSALLGEVDMSLGTDYRIRFLTDAKDAESWMDLVRIAHDHASRTLAADLAIDHSADYYLGLHRDFRFA